MGNGELIYAIIWSFAIVSFFSQKIGRKDKTQIISLTVPPKNDIYSRQSKLVLQPHLSSSTNIIHQETRAKEGAVWLWEGNRNWSLVIVGSLVWIWPVRLTLLKSCANKGTGFQLTQLESLLWRLFSHYAIRKCSTCTSFTADGRCLLHLSSIFL